MLANELISRLQKMFFKDNFAGLYASDKIPKYLQNRQFIILNTDPSNLPGRHWFAAVRINNVIECFDSLGITNQKKVFIINHLNIDGVNYLQFNTTQLQPSSSVLCGQYVLYFLFERFHNLDINFDDLLNQIFTDDHSKNEERVIHFMNDFFSHSN